MAPQISYAPGSLPGTPLIYGDVTIGPSPVQYPNYNTTGKVADAGEIADCLNQLVIRIEALEAIISANPAYGITAT